jgi:X-linked retinitis pigmentosa GTPase regulator
VSLKSKVREVSVGGCFGAAVDETNKVWTWGSNSSGELGVGDYEPRVNPFPIVALHGKAVTRLSCGGTFAMALG